MKQVNISTNVDGIKTPWISDWSKDGYVGELIDTRYSDRVDTTNWCVFYGTQEKCEEYINKHFLLPIEKREEKTNKTSTI